jgi:hypothetical protein
MNVWCEKDSDVFMMVKHAGYINVRFMIYISLSLLNMAIENHRVKWTDWKKGIYMNEGISVARF